MAFELLERLFRDDRSASIEQFKNIMDIAQQIAVSNPKALRELIKALLRPHRLTICCTQSKAPRTPRSAQLLRNIFLWVKSTQIYLLKGQERCRAVNPIL